MDESERYGDDGDGDDDFDDGNGDCAFCMGREAAHAGEPEEANPFPQTDALRGSDEWWDSQHTLWMYGFGLGFSESGRGGSGAPEGTELRERDVAVVRSTGEIMAASNAVKRDDPYFVKLKAEILLSRERDGERLCEEWRVLYWARPGE